jgi:two-component system, NtrC family, response regulator HydG
MKKGSILLVDDNKVLLQAWNLFIKPFVEKIDTLHNPELLIEKLRICTYDLVLLDMNFKAGVTIGNEGLFWLKKILDQNPSQSVIVITAFGDIELAVQAMKLGAVDFLNKDWDEDKILSSILAGLRLDQSKQEIQRLRQTRSHLQNQLNHVEKLIRCPSSAMKPVYMTIDKVAKTDANILLLGENGTGKEVIAEEIHRQSHRNQESFISIDLASIPGTLFESELFGYVRGAFTDARSDKPGRMELASGGTLFLDEIGNLSYEVQAKLLSVIQSKVIYRVGSVFPQRVDFRLICATNQDLSGAIGDKTFREDLFFRINTITIQIPPLRERPEDIPTLSSYFLNVFNEKYQKNTSLHPDSLKVLLSYTWPGNVRELRHLLEKGVILAEGNLIRPEHFNPDNKFAPSLRMGHCLNLDENETIIIRMALQQCHWNITQAAVKLNINRSTLYEKIRKYGINKD